MIWEQVAIAYVYLPLMSLVRSTSHCEIIGAVLMEWDPAATLLDQVGTNYELLWEAMEGQSSGVQTTPR